MIHKKGYYIVVVRTKQDDIAKKKSETKSTNGAKEKIEKERTRRIILGLAKKIASRNKQREARKKGPARQHKWVTIEETMRIVRGQLFIEMLGFLHDKRGFGKKRLEDFCNEFRKYYDGMKLYRVSPDDIKGVLKEETGFDVRNTRMADDY